MQLAILIIVGSISNNINFKLDFLVLKFIQLDVDLMIIEVADGVNATHY